MKRKTKKFPFRVLALYSLIIVIGCVVFSAVLRSSKSDAPRISSSEVKTRNTNAVVAESNSSKEPVELDAKEAKIKMVEKLAMEFVDAIEKRDFRKIYSYTQENEFSQKEAIPEMYIADFEMLYKDDPNGWKSFSTIIKSGKIETKITPFKDNIYFVDFYPSHLSKNMSDEDYLRENYGKTFFSCNFKLVENRLWLHESFCYSETEGPYEIDYGDQ